MHRPEASFVLRSSPVNCVCDAFHFMLSLIIESILHKSLKGGMISVVKHRFRHANGDRENSLGKLQSNRIFRLAIFALGALPQFIKLLGCQGIRMTVVCASLYLGSFLVLEVLVYLSNKGSFGVIGTGTTEQSEFTDAPFEKDWGLVLSHVAGVISTFISIYLLTAALYHIIDVVVQHPWPYLLASAMFGLVTALRIQYSTGDSLSTIEASTEGPLAIILALSLGVFPPLLAKVRDASGGRNLWIYIIAILLMCIGLIGGTTYWYFDFARKRRTDNGESGRYVCLLLLNIIAVLLYYAFVYEPTGTFKPAWADQLG